MVEHRLQDRHDRLSITILKGGLVTREGVAFWILLLIAVAGDLWLGVLNFILGYAGFLVGAVSTPITPVTDFMSVFTFTAVFVKLYKNDVALFSTIAVGISTVLAALASFEFAWGQFQIIGNTYTSWLGYTGAEWHYVFAFNSLSAFWFIGIRYWKITWWSSLLMISYPLSFVAWYLSGYPQPWASSTIDSAFLWNASVKVLSFVGLLSPLLGFKTYRSATGESH